MTFCSNCGSEAHSEGQFCRSCGQRAASGTARPRRGTATHEPEIGVFEPPVRIPIQQLSGVPSLAIPIIFGWAGAWWASNKAAKLGVADTGRYWKAGIISSISVAAVSLLVPFTMVSLLGIALYSADATTAKTSNSRISPPAPRAERIAPGSATAAPSAEGIAPGPSTAAPGVPTVVPVDQAKVAALTGKVSANPKDVASLQGLGDAYFAAADYRNAAVWEQRVFELSAEEHLWQPTFVLDHPVEISPLTKGHRSKKGLVERFEPFAACMEIGNAYSELNDPEEQMERLKEQESKRIVNEEAQPMDEDFLLAIDTGMPPTGGVGLGIERVVMLLTDRPSIRDIILFPTMKLK